MSSPIHILDYQMVSSMGLDVVSNLDALKQERSGIQVQTLPISKHVKPYGAIQKTDDALRQLIQETFTHHHLNIHQLPRASLLHILAFKNLLHWFDYSASSKIGLISANTVGGIDSTSYQLKNNREKLNIPYHEAGAITKNTLDFFNQDFWHTTISTACSSSANSIIMGAKLLAQGQLDLVIVGGVDALTQYTINGFLSLKILDDKRCEPFSKNRAGLNLGEGAAFLVMASKAWAEKNNIQAKAQLSGFGNANDAYHQTASSPEGIGNFQAMNKALLRAKISAEEIDYVNAHGTGTDNNDASENNALSRIFENSTTKPLMSSTKTYTGHTLGAAGAIEAVISLMAIEEQYAWGQGAKTELMESLCLNVLDEGRKHSIQHVLSNSFGFGGNCSSILLSKIN